MPDFWYVFGFSVIKNHQRKKRGIGRVFWGQIRLRLPFTPSCTGKRADFPPELMFV
jgi:hypothetical protein